MKKIINNRVFTGSMIGIYAACLVGCKFEPSIEVPKTIDPLTIGEVNDEEVVYFDNLKDINVYFDYSVDTENNVVFYGSSVLKEVSTDDYTAYYNYKNGNLVSVVFNKTLSTEDKFYYRDYINSDYIKVSSLEEQLYNPYNTKTIKNGINYDSEYIDYDSLRLMEASIIPHNKLIFNETLDNVYKEKKLTR